MDNSEVVIPEKTREEMIEHLSDPKVIEAPPQKPATKQSKTIGNRQNHQTTSKAIKTYQKHNKAHIQKPPKPSKTIKNTSPRCVSRESQQQNHQTTLTTVTKKHQQPSETTKDH